MLAVTPRFLAALKQTHTVAVAANVFRPNALTVAIAVPVIGGQVTIDRDARIGRQATLEVGFSLGDEFTRDVLKEIAFGGRASILRGIRYADGTSELVQLGHFRVESVVWEELQGRATLTLADSMAQVEAASFLTPWVATGKPSNACVEAVHQVYGDTILYQVETTPADEPTLSGTIYEEDRAGAVTDLAASVGAWAYFDNIGNFLLRPRDRDVGVVWTLEAGPEGTLVAASETLDRSNVRNGVVVRGQPAADEPPVNGFAFHTDPSSPTRWDGPFGNVPLVVSSTAVGSQEQADHMAQTLLNLRLGLSRTVTLTAVPNPALEPDDRIEIVFGDGRREEHTINSVSIGLDAGGSLELTTTSQYRPELAPLRKRVFAGDTAWRELEEATA